GVVPGPDVLSCGRILSATSPGGAVFTPMYRQADGPDEIRKAVREQVRDGADFIKIMATGARSVERENPEPAQLTREEIATVVEEAHRIGLRVAAHAEGLEGTRLAIEEGVDTIEHGLSLHRDPRLLELMAEKDITLVPTLSTFHDLAEQIGRASCRERVKNPEGTVSLERKTDTHKKTTHNLTTTSVTHTHKRSD